MKHTYERIRMRKKTAYKIENYAIPIILWSIAITQHCSSVHFCFEQQSVLKYGRHYRIQQEKHFINSEYLFNTPGMCIFSYFIRSCNRLPVYTSYENSNDNPERHNNKNA